MKYKYTRKEVVKRLKKEGYFVDFLKDDLLATIPEVKPTLMEMSNSKISSPKKTSKGFGDKSKKMSFNDFVVNNHHLWNKGCKICGCKSEFAHYEGCPVLGTVLGTKVKPTPSPLAEIEETEEIKIPMVLIKPRPNDIVDFITCDITPKLNSLIRNQRLIVKQLKIK